MRTGIKKSHKTTEIFFDEGSDILVINTERTSNYISAGIVFCFILCQLTRFYQILHYRMVPRELTEITVC